MKDRQPLATKPEAAAYLKVPERTLDQWRYLGKGPRWSKVGRYVRYRWEDLDAYVNENAKGGTA